MHSCVERCPEVHGNQILTSDQKNREKYVMVSSWKKASLLAVVLMMAAPALAQGPGGGGRGGFRGGFGGGFGGGSPYGLLGNPAVQEELALSDEQKTKATSLLEAMRESQRSAAPGQQNRESFRDLSNEERRERFSAIRKEMEERNAKLLAEYQPKFADVLDEVQLQRLQQLQWQLQGNRALQDAELAKALGLSQEQKEKIEAIYNENRGQGFGRQGGQGQGANNPQDRDARRAEFQARAEKLDQDLKAVLTDAQRTELANQLGEPFDLAKLRGPEGRRGPGGPEGFRGRGGRGQGQGGNRSNNN